MIKTLTSLRFYMAIIIFISHLAILPSINFNNYLNNGGYGVIFFFILSGFVMAINYKDKFEAVTKENWLTFVKKRIKRIYPLYIFMIMLGLAFEVATNSDMWSLQFFLKQGVKLMLCIPMIQTLIPKMSIAQAFNGAAWFLSCLFILYIVTPFILKMLYKVNKRNKEIFIIMILTIVILECLLIILKDNIDITYCTPYIRIFYYFIGILAGIIFANKKETILGRAKKQSFELLELLSIIVIVLGWIFTYKAKFANVLTIIIMTYSIFVFAFQKGTISKIMSYKINVFLGKISFEFYLIHYVVIKYLGATSISKDSNYIIVSGIAFLLSIVLSVLIYALQTKFDKMVKVKKEEKINGK